ncbi:MAG TPA: hypothetical protein VD706_00515 [Candidatus Saccharimonadales bacterium]|nr:hypothetical protein [Candidatus Saccharimonadales bacterium]
MSSRRQSSGPEGSGYPAPTWRGLSAEARSALVGQSIGSSPASRLLEETEKVARGPEDLAEPVLTWAKQQLEGSNGQKGAFRRWEKYEDLLSTEVPATLDELLEKSPQLASTIERLFKASRALTASGQTAPSGSNVGETMGLVLVPWETFQDLYEENQRTRVNMLHRWVKTCSERHSGIRNGFRISEEGLQRGDPTLAKAFSDDAPMYRDVAKPSKMIRLTEHLKAKIAEEGPWGLILAQNAGSGGYWWGEEFTGPQFAGDWTDKGKAHFQIAGYNVDAMGVYEFIAHAFQEDEMDEKVPFLLLANRVNGYGSFGGVKVPFGYYAGGEIGLLLRDADGGDDGSRFAEPPRILLTVGSENG